MATVSDKETLHTVVDRELAARIRQAAEADDRSVSYFLRRLALRELASNKPA